MDWDLPLAALCGLSVGFAVYRFLSPDGFVAGATAAVYVGASYFYLAFDVSLLGSAVQFDDRTDRLGHAIGLFGLSVSPIAFAQYYGGDGATTLPLVILFAGVIAFLLLMAEAQTQSERVR